MNSIKLPAIGISGHITMHRWNKDDPSRDITVGPTCNLITDAILASRIGDGGFAMNASIRQALAYCRVGTANTPPAFSDTALAAQIAATNNNIAGPTAYGNHDENGRGYVSLSTTYQFLPGEATGTLQEVGFGSTAAGDVLMSRALIKDLANVPTPLVIGPSDYLNVVYEVRLYTNYDTSDVMQYGVLIAGNFHDITIRPIGAASITELITDAAGIHWTSFNSSYIGTLNIQGAGNNWLGAFEDVMAMPSVEESWPMGVLSPVIDANTSLAAYVPNSKQRSIDVTIPTSEFNLVDGIRYFRLSTSEGSWGMEIDPPLFKTSSDTLTFTILVQALQRHTP